MKIKQIYEFLSFSFLFCICDPHNPPLDPPMICVIAIDLFNQLQRELFKSIYYRSCPHRSHDGESKRYRVWKNFLHVWNLSFSFDNLIEREKNFFQTFDFSYRQGLIMIFYICVKNCLFSKSQFCVIIRCLFVRERRSNKRGDEADFLTISRRHESASRQREDNGADARADRRLNEVIWV